MLASQYQAVGVARIDLGDPLEMLVGLRELAVLLEDDAAAKMRVRVVRVPIEDAGQELQSLIEIGRRRLRPATGFLGLLRLDARCRSAARSPG